MIIVLSPAKTLDFESRPVTRVHSQSEMLDHAQALIEQLRDFDAPGLAELMSVSDALADLNVGRFQQWQPPFTPRNAKQAVLAFAGDVYDGLGAPTLDTAQLKWSQGHLRILSGLYGVLRPLDLMQAYRLEMGTRLENPRGRDLYAFWGDRIARHLAAALTGHRHPVLVNLASKEYFQAVNVQALGCPIVQPVFQELRESGYKVVSFNAKRARGMMARYAIENRITNPERLKTFDRAGYRFDAKASSLEQWFFRREAP